MRPVYLDHNATTPLGAEARAAMEPYLEGQFGNPLTSHRFGMVPRGAVESARRELAELLGAGADDCDVVFNSGGTEGLNHAVKGIAFRALVDGRAGERRRIVIGGIEHYAVAKSAEWLAQRFGFEVALVAPARDGIVPLDRFAAALGAGGTALAALQWANNEVGTLQPVREVGALCRERGVPFVCDAVQVAGKVDLSGALGFADVLAFSAHKLYGPKGVGALVVRRGVEIDPLHHGAPQEAGSRGGTHNVPGIVGFAASLRDARDGLPRESPRLASLRDLLWTLVHGRIERVTWNAKGSPLLPNTINLSFDGCPSPELCEEMDHRGFAISPGAACRSGDVKPSHTLLAMGATASIASSSVRVSLGHGTTRHDVQAAADAFADAVARIRAGR